MVTGDCEKMFREIVCGCICLAIYYMLVKGRGLSLLKTQNCRNLAVKFFVG